MATAFRFDLNSCTGCQACELACIIENELRPGQSWRTVSTFNPSRVPELPLYHLSLACNHCGDAPCADACPALAYSRDEGSGALLIEPDRCMGCHYCSWACPYDAPRFDAAAGIMRKCTFCNDRLARGQLPACVAACPTAALGCQDTGVTGGVDTVPGFPHSDARPSIRFVPLRPGHAVPESTLELPSDLLALLEDEGKALAPVTIGLRSEWPLLLFSLLASLLVACFGAARDELHAPLDAVFMATAVLATLASSAHLGRPRKAWRAVLNLRRSWLSRELLAWSGFVALSAASLSLAPDSTLLATVALVAGVLSLFCIDRVYDRVRPEAWRKLHSADALPMGVFFAGLLLDMPLLTAMVGVLKLTLYLDRKHRRRRMEQAWRPPWSLARVGLLLAVTLSHGIMGVHGSTPLILAMALLGELVDRGEFYQELEIRGIEAEMQVQWRRSMAA